MPSDVVLPVGVTPGAVAGNARYRDVKVVRRGALEVPIFDPSGAVMAMTVLQFQ